MRKVRFHRLTKALLMVFSILIFTSVILIISACKCNHDYLEEITKPATCSSAGEVTYTCSICGEFYTEVIPALDGHKLSSNYLSDDTAHWQKCENCDYTTEKVVHAYSYQKQDDLHWQHCEVCGFTTDKVKHEFSIQGAIVPSSCTLQGSSAKACVCGATNTESLPLADHSYITYQKEGNLHWQKCENCDATTVKTEHSFTVQGTVVLSTCIKQGSDTKACVCGETHTDKLPFGEHDVTYYPEKAMTETEPGNKPYWQCKVCKRYFSGQDCEIEWFKEEIFTYPNQNKVNSIADLVEVANKLADGSVSDEYYQITATVDGYDSEANVFLISDDTEAIYATFIERENVYTIYEKDIITLKGKLCKVDDEVTLLECEVISIKCDDDEIHSLFITVTNDCKYTDFYPNVFVEDESLGEWYYANTNNYNCIVTGCTLKITNYVYDVVLQKVIINDKSYSMTDRTLEITVGNEDIYIEFVFDEDNYCSVTLSKLDTSNNQGEAIVADAYISYTYTNGGYNEYGRLYKNSHLTFTAENANITGINITYDIDWIDKDNNIKALENAVNVIQNNDVKIKYEQGSLSNRGQIKIQIPFSAACTVLEYFANVGQAHVTEIIILYQTYNS